MLKYRVYGIRWDTAHEDDVDLFTECTVEVPQGMDTEDLEEHIGDWLSQLTGFCHKGFLYEPIKD